MYIAIPTNTKPSAIRTDANCLPRAPGWRLEFWADAYGLESTIPGGPDSFDELVIIPGWGFDNRIFGSYHGFVNLIIPDAIELSRFLNPPQRIDTIRDNWLSLIPNTLRSGGADGYSDGVLSSAYASKLRNVFWPS